MKTVVITDAYGVWLEDTDEPVITQTVTPIYSSRESDNPKSELVHPVLIGYRVAVPVTPGLYKPRFDLSTWKAWDGTGEQPLLWIEGLSPEEIAAMHPEPKPPIIEQLQAENADLKVRIETLEPAVLELMDAVVLLMGKEN